MSVNGEVMFSKLKKYSLEELLIFISEYSRGLFNNNETIRCIDLFINRGKYRIQHKMIISTWDLVDLSYYAVKNTSDYREKNISLNNFYELVNEYRGFSEKKDIKLDSIEKDKMSFYIMYVLSQKQFWYQETYNNIELFNRNIDILINIQKVVDSRIDIDEVVMDEIGISKDKYINISLLLFGIGLKNSEISKNLFGKENLQLINCNKEEIYKFLNYYSSNYEEIRKSALKENHFLVKPIVKTNSGKYIIVNTFLLLRLLSDGLYWVVRNYYFNKKSSIFVNEFGIYFEKYVEQLFKECLVKGTFNKIDESGIEKKADWKIETEEYILLIEQKSILASIMLKRQYPDLNLLLNYIYKYEEAFEQLNSSENRLLNQEKINKPILKLVLFYDSLYNTETVKDEIVKKRGNLKQDENTYFISIRELEILVYLLKNNPNDFKIVMNEKLKREKENSNDGKGFDIILRDLNLNKNDYINKYKNNFNRYIELLRPN